MEVYSIPGFQEPICSLTHLLAAPVFVVLGYFLVLKGRAHLGYQISLFLMAFSTVFLLSMSGVYHLLGPGLSRDVIKQLDIAGVFALIAGTATPVHAILFTGFQRWAPLALAWTAAVAGITLRTIFADQLPLSVGTAIFLVMGWGGSISCVLLWKRYGFAFAAPLLWGGLAYSVGAAILIVHRPYLIPGVIGPHELWHVAVLVGLGYHWSFVSSFAAGPPKVESELPMRTADAA